MSDWVHSVRDHKQFEFIDRNDVSSLVVLNVGGDGGFQSHTVVKTLFIVLSATAVGAGQEFEMPSTFFVLLGAADCFFLEKKFH